MNPEALDWLREIAGTLLCALAWVALLLSL